MRWLAVAVLVAGAVLMVARCDRASRPISGVEGPARVQVYFSPNGGCTDAIVRELGTARREVLVQAYLLSSRTIAAALIEAHKRRVPVRLVVNDPQGDPDSQVPMLADAGIAVLVDREHGCAHNKVMVIDGETAITGSFNLTWAAEVGNAENLAIIRRAPEVVSAYRSNFEAHAAHSSPYRGGRR